MSFDSESFRFGKMFKFVPEASQQLRVQNPGAGVAP
jgi:hypothetical protein